MDGGVVPLVGPHIFFALVLKPLLSGGKAPEAAVEENAKKVWEEQAGPLLAYLEKELGDNEYFVGNRLTIADIGVASILVNTRHAGFAPERKRFPKLRAFLDRMWSRPSMKKLIDEDTPVFGKRSALITD
jgi:glutathione S-transferase